MAYFLLIVFVVLYMMAWVGSHFMLLYYVSSGNDAKDKMKMVILLIGGIIPLINMYVVYEYVIKKVWVRS